jgi:uncharacterized protein (TIGR02246 family)
MKIIIIIATTFFIFSISAFSQSDDTDAIKALLKQYNSAIEKLDATGTEDLFIEDSKIFESGGGEGSYRHYLEHHLTPELKEFKSFRFNDYIIDVHVDGNYAFADEEFKYQIISKENEEVVTRNAVTTSVLKKIDGEWKIAILHFSSHK